ncbi:hypothetical protein B0T16DRAFT_454348 [Cercophora newfieldiana]|uniref:ASX DEUBAD domain-containing protein n=1 Tax=Cercophora newfieldiana TaxID=92897 RepID=A0AA39YG60_9PEZI|nr:hypothetical protein B0T16DRAFT_454348 [Cercophora newfieldiana]
MSETGSSSSLSAPPASKSGGGSSDASSQNASIAGPGPDPAAEIEWPLSLADLRGGKATTRSQARKSGGDDIENTVIAEHSEHANEEEDENENVEPVPASAKLVRSTRSTRSAKAREGNNNDADAQDATITGEADANAEDGRNRQVSHKRKASTQNRGSSPKAARVSLQRQAKSKKWDAPYVLTNSNSPLVESGEHNDLFKMLMRPGAWDVLSQDEKAKILALFPHESWILDPGTPQARPDTQLLMNNTAFRSDVVGYARGIERGHHAEQWLKRAWAAHRTHISGGFDDYLAMEFKATWGEDMPACTKHNTSITASGLGEDGGTRLASPPAKKRARHSPLQHRTSRPIITRSAKNVDDLAEKSRDSVGRVAEASPEAAPEV